MVVAVASSYLEGLRQRASRTYPSVAEAKAAIWVASLAAAAALNLLFLWLATIAPSGPSVPALSPSKRAAVEIVFRPRIPPLPDLSAHAVESEPPGPMPPRFKPRMPLLHASPSRATDVAAPLPRLRLNLNACDPADEEKMRAPECAAPDDWRRAGRDASELLGANAQGYTLDEVAIARGWIKPKPRSGQDAMAAQTDSTLPQSVFKDAPFPPHAIERTGGW